jgi:hypothetical protein
MERNGSFSDSPTSYINSHILGTLETQIENHHTKPMFLVATFTTDLNSMQYKNNGWEK